MRIIAAAAVVAALAVPVPAAAADHHVFGCSFRSVQQEDVTGPYFEGFAYGYVAGDADDAVAVSCEIRVNGSTAARTPTGSGTAAAYTAGSISYVAGDTDVVAWCTIVTLNGTTTEDCRSGYVQIPPTTWNPVHVLLEFVTELLYTADAAACPLLAARTGTYGPVTVTDQGDVYIDGEPWWDCPPYDIWPARG